ncbi:hypothetical protein ID866_10156 [Astraeus odoratus]|nr:hypothetical protein ID866_10156 [Astraeus odoratus]
MVFGWHVMLLCQYSKTTALTGQDKLIPHGLDAVTSNILIQDLIIVCPFAQLAAKICFADSKIAIYSLTSTRSLHQKTSCSPCQNIACLMFSFT